jgi:hypothetical protein
MIRITLTILVLLLAATTVFAQSVTKLEISGLTGSCNANSITGSYTITAYDANGNALEGTFNVTRAYTSNDDTSGFIGDITSGQSLPFVIDNPQGTVVLARLHVWLTDDPSVRAAGYFLDCATGQWGGIFEGDGRLNYNLGDLHAALYVGVDDSGAMALDVYTIQSDSKGLFIGQFNAEDFAVKSPETNTLIDTVGSATLYALTSGEYQVNISGGGKVYAVIFSWPPHHVYGYTIER